ncbi:hypothetical protein EYF80_057025 [Liparis tanakae]|uniref:Uncharacterized protein n=1 Tax=Liparis tanakae TaxID=230148 RepID=A0A4Z2EWT0_9TELE|nr:hypothetical protein EYF80_057025 [Liparis tanakae]
MVDEAHNQRVKMKMKMSTTTEMKRLRRRPGPRSRATPPSLCRACRLAGLTYSFTLWAGSSRCSCCSRRDACRGRGGGRENRDDIIGTKTTRQEAEP